MITMGGTRGGARRGARRLARNAALLGALTSFAFALVPSGASAQDEEAVAGPESFAGAASAAAIEVSVLTPALVPVEGLFDLIFVEGRGTYESSNQEGRSSLVFPGNGLVIGPNLLCGTFLGPEIPPEGEVFFGPIIRSCLQYEYPLTVYVDSLQPDAATDGGLTLGAPADPISFGAVGARAHAGADATTTDAEANDLRVLGLPAAGSLGGLFDLLGLETPDTTLVSVENMTATTDQRIVGTDLVVDAEATVSGLRLMGGIVRIGSIISHSRLVTGPGHEPELSADIEVSGVEVAGTPAQLTEDGLVLGTPSGTGPLLQQLTSTVGSVLQDAALRVEALPAEQGESDGIPFAGVGGVLIEFSTPLAGLPPIPGPIGDADVNGSYGVRMRVGTTGVRGFADTFTDAPPITRPAVTTPAATGGGSTGSGSSSSGAGAPGVVTTPPTTGGVGAPTPTTAPAEPASFLGDLFADRLGFLYLSFTLTALALCLAPRLTLPARLPAAQS